MGQPQEYRPRRDQGLLLIAIAIPLLAVGVGVIPDGGQGAACWFGLFGVTIALIGVAHLRTRVEVGPGGVVKRPRLTGGFTVRWTAVESWSVVDLRAEDTDDNFSHQAVRFVVGRRHLEVRESQVHRPGFEAFVADVRTWVGGSENSESAVAPDGGA